MHLFYMNMKLDFKLSFDLSFFLNFKFNFVMILVRPFFLFGGLTLFNKWYYLASKGRVWGKKKEKKLFQNSWIVFVKWDHLFCMKTLALGFVHQAGAQYGIEFAFQSLLIPATLGTASHAEASVKRCE